MGHGVCAILPRPERRGLSRHSVKEIEGRFQIRAIDKVLEQLQDIDNAEVRF